MLLSASLKLALFASAAHALYFSISAITASDTWIPSEHHELIFTVYHPAVVYAQGGSDPADCTIAWNDCDVPTCWTQCSANGYYARVAAGSYKGAENFSLDIWQEFVYELANHNNATIAILGGTEYTCSGDSERTVCSLSTGQAINQTLQTYYGGATPPGLICS